MHDERNFGAFHHKPGFGWRAGGPWGRWATLAGGLLYLLGWIGGPLPVESSETGSGTRVAAAARAQVGKTTGYDSAYRALSYPGGDVPIETGVCTDVVIRALRAGLGMDLQKLVHEDMKRHFTEYPQNWGLRSADKNIDHRRVPNLRTYFKRQGWELTLSKKNPGQYLPGDLVTCVVPPSLPHIMIVSERKSAAGAPLVIHNIGSGACEEDRLFEFKITGHYRIPVNRMREGSVR